MPGLDGSRRHFDSRVALSRDGTFTGEENLVYEELPYRASRPLWLYPDRFRLNCWRLDTCYPFSTPSEMNGIVADRHLRYLSLLARRAALVHEIWTSYSGSESTMNEMTVQSLRENLLRRRWCLNMVPAAWVHGQNQGTVCTDKNGAGCKYTDDRRHLYNGAACHTFLPERAVFVVDGFSVHHTAAEKFGQRLHGFFRAPVTGSFRFSVAADEGAELYFGDTEEDQAKIASVPLVGGAPPPHWSKHLEQTSASIDLVAGQEYYIAAISTGTAAASALAVSVHLPNGEHVAPIPLLDPGTAATPYLSSIVSAPRALGPLETAAGNRIEFSATVARFVRHWVGPYVEIYKDRTESSTGSGFAIFTEIAVWGVEHAESLAGDMAVFSCDSGYQLAPDAEASATCQGTTGSWSEAVYVLASACYCLRVLTDFDLHHARAHHSHTGAIDCRYRVA